MQIEYRIISIGTLAAHPLWNEKGQARTGHATTTLIRTGDAIILVDPSLPTPAIRDEMPQRTVVSVRSVATLTTVKVYSLMGGEL